MKLRRRLALLFLVTSLLVSLFSIEAVAAPRLTDIKGHWAEEAILALVDKGVINGYPDRTFKPGQEVTRAEFAKMLALAFGVQPKAQISFTDVKAEHWAADYISALAEKEVIEGYPDGTFRPHNKITRTEAITMVARVLDLLNNDETRPDWAQSFVDVNPDHWAFIPVELAQRLRILPPQWTEALQPKNNVTRAELAYLLFKANDFEVTKGTVTSVDTKTNTVVLRPVVGNRQLFMLSSDAIILRNGSPTNLSTFLEGDQIHILSEKAGDARYVKALGMLTQDDVSNKISTLTDGLLGPEQISAIVRRDWSALGNSMRGNLYNELIEMGATPAEAESLLAQDWTGMTSLGQERLLAGLSNTLGVSPEMIGALLNRDWKKAEEMAQVELTEKLLSKLLF